MHRLMLPLLLACCAAGHAAEPPVAHYGQEATGDDANAPGGQLREQVIMRAVADYLGEHPEEWMPSETDVEAALPAFRQSVACLPYPPAASMDDPETGRFIVAGLIAGNSAQRFLHRNFGGGRLLFQQADTEAFDATHKLAQKLEAQGKFSFATPSCAPRPMPTGRGITAHPCPRRPMKRPRSTRRPSSSPASRRRKGSRRKRGRGSRRPWRARMLAHA